jgi:N-acetylglucosaminyldiphosphoundecaprenol N-acetyl-beta-D-mannosaminyltransferase
MTNSINILGVKVHAITIDHLHETMAAMIHAKEHVLILNTNLHALNLAFENPWLRQFLNQADVVFADGFGVILAACLLGQRIPQRITYADWMWELAGFAEKAGYSMFFLGGEPTIAEKAARQLRRRFPTLTISGTHDGYFDRDPMGRENGDLIALINSVSPNILVVGMGMPIQERWLMENWDRLNANIALTGGAVFDYVSGTLPRAPRWVTEHGLEWLGRLVIEPRRLWKRYILGNPLFFWRLFRYHFMKLPLPD